ncbi:MAG TPA: hypothetical protein VFV52_16265 [Bacilli bacterium]|nr:hypothetical protein [Bacilli bacterium]
MFHDEDALHKRLHTAYLKIYELESANIIASNRWREDDGTFGDLDFHDEYYFEFVGGNRQGVSVLLASVDELVHYYPAFLITPLLRAFGALTVRVLKGSRAYEGSLLAIWRVLKRLESHTATDTQAENGWAVLKSAWEILLQVQEDIRYGM